MSYFPFNSNENATKNNKYNPNNFIKKERFHNTKDKDFFCDTPGFWQYEKKWDVVDDESNLKTPGVGTRLKTKVEMVQELHPNNYAIPVANVIATKKDEKFYFPGYETGPGRGFGNLNVSNDIRIGDYTRTETRNYKAQKESEVIDRWQYIDNRFQNPNNLVLPIPRGGESTRKNNQVFTSSDTASSFEFEY